MMKNLEVLEEIRKQGKNLIETKFRVLNQEYSLSYDQNPIEGIKTRVKSY